MPQTNGFIRFTQPYRGRLTRERYYQRGDVDQFTKQVAHALVDSGYAEHITDTAQEVRSIAPLVLSNPHATPVPLEGPDPLANMAAENAAIAEEVKAQAEKITPAVPPEAPAIEPETQSAPNPRRKRK